MKTPKQNTKPSLISAFKKQIPSSQAQQTKLMKNSYLIRSSAFSVALLAVSFLASNSARAAVVAMIDPKMPSAGSGAKDITHEDGTFSSTAMQTLITTTNDLTLAGVLDSEGTFDGGDFSNDTGALSDKITGATRYGRQGSIDVSASGSRWGYVESTETWTPDVLYIGPYSNAGLTHFGLITSSITNRDRLTVTVTYSDATTESLAGVKDQTNWLGFHKDGEIITSIQLDDNNQATSFTWANYDDVSLVFSVPEPSSTALLGLGGLALVLRRKRS
jgi:hypothetical protein